MAEIKTTDDTLNDDNFTKAFDMLSSIGDKAPPADLLADEPAAATTTDPAAAAADPAPVVVPPAGEQTEFVDPAAKAEADAAAARPVEADADAAAAKPVEAAKPDPLERLADLLQKNQQQAPQPAPVRPAQQQAPLFSAEEATFLSEYEKDFPDVARAEGLRRRAENNVLVQHIFNEVAKVIKPIQDAAFGVMEQQHTANLHQAAPDYDTVRDKVLDWVETQPSYLQVAYKHVIEQGTVTEVADLINRYKASTGVAPAATAAASAAPAAKETELPAAAKQAAAALAPVGSKRSVAAKGEPSTFEDAFAAFAGQS